VCECGYVFVWCVCGVSCVFVGKCVWFVFGVHLQMCL